MRTSRMIPVIAALAVAACDNGEPAGPGQTPPAVASVVVHPDTVTLTVGQTHALQARPYAADGTLLTGRVGTWSSSDTSVVVVDSVGTATARAAG